MFYLYDPSTKVFTRETEGQKDPLGGGFLTPPFSTTIKPPKPLAFLVPQFTNNAWTLIPDYSNTNIYLKSDASLIKLELGENITADMTTFTPVDTFPKWDVNKWVVDQVKVLQQAKDNKLTEIEEDFEAAEAVPIVYQGVSYNGGMESGVSIDYYVRVQELNGYSLFNIWDINGTEHILTKVEVSELTRDLGTQTSINKFDMKDRKVALNAATTVSAVELI